MKQRLDIWTIVLTAAFTPACSHAPDQDAANNTEEENVTVSESELSSAIVCESRYYKYNKCSVGFTIRTAWVLEKYSRADCIEGDTWGFEGDYIWVENGCRAKFGTWD
ncbi:DUF3011 domain-containing protein [Sorangium sp. So ce136]|uniref:DUF3011 domain-containing protein n=1 Tax=Sorangium sp. So ce136 TaxID=3133284 RepID=UPI003F10A11A